MKIKLNNREEIFEQDQLSIEELIREKNFTFKLLVTKINGKYLMFAQAPVSVADQGAFCVATADKPEGPWDIYEGNPVRTPGESCAWDDGGFS